jgi:3-oxoacyl-[acyl-carrier protein] reductase
MELENLVSVITGSARGIGKSIAEKFYQEGSRVVIWDSNLEAAGEAAKSLDTSGKKAIAVEVDITRDKDVQSAVSKVMNVFGRIDVLVNNAGILRHKKIDEMSLEDFEVVIKTNLTGTFICCRAVVPIMRKQKRGKIINISSLAGRTGRLGVGVNYAAAKAGIVGFTQTLARELGSSGIYVNAIAPGPILTELTKQVPAEVFTSWNEGRAIEKNGTPEDIADAAVFLSSRHSDWVTGVTLDVNGGILIR